MISDNLPQRIITKPLRQSIWVVYLVCIAACSPGFDRSAMMTDITETVILENHAKFVDASAALLGAAEALSASPTEDNLSSVQAAWRGASIAWMGCSPFEFDVVKDALIHNRIDNRPARDKFIEEKVAGNETLDAELLAGVGSSSQGLSAIEYLIFSDGILDDPRRMEYVVASAEVVHENGVALHKIWSADGGNYARLFIDGDFDGGNTQGSMNMLFNQLLEQIEMITWDRLGKPMGKRTGGEIRTDLVEAPLSQSFT